MSNAFESDMLFIQKGVGVVANNAVELTRLVGGKAEMLAAAAAVLAAMAIPQTLPEVAGARIASLESASAAAPVQKEAARPGVGFKVKPGYSPGF